MIRPASLLICALVGFSVPEAASQQIFTGSVSGRVLDADTGAPLAGIVVEAGSTDIEAVTDSRGRYTLGGLRPGQVSISARGGNNRIFSLTAPRPVRVLAGAESSGIDLPVRLTAAISGRVFDPDGNPIPGIEVSALRAEYSILGVYGAGREYANGAAWLHRDGQATTDDRGRYVIDGLSAGRTYRILAHPQRQSAPVSDAPADPERRNRVLAPGYYPNAPSMSQALPVVLGSLETRDNVDIRMSDGPSFCVQAALDGDPMPVVSGEPGARARPVRFFVAREDIAAYENLRSLGVSGDFGPDGLLRICGLSPGTYVLAALGPQEGRMPSTYSSMTFVVSDRDVGGIRITANPLLSISGEAVWESTPPDVEQPPELTVRVARQAGTVWDASATSVPGTFSLRVPSGVHSSLEISGVTPPFYVRDVTYDGRSILRSSLTTSPNGRLRIILARDAASLRVLATDALGEAVEHATVLVLSADAPSESALATAMLAGTTDADGAYVVSGLPPGRYHVLATDNPPPVLYGPYPSPRVYIEKTPETLARLLAIRSQGTLVELSPDSTSAITVSLRNIR